LPDTKSSFIHKNGRKIVSTTLHLVAPSLYTQSPPIEDVSNPNYVCTICSQTFTRRWRGSVQNNKFHGGLGSVVRLLDYIVGRACGQFLPGDPSLFRRKNKWEKSAKEAREKPNSIRDLEDSLLKMAELKRLTGKYFPPDEVQRILLTVQVQCQIKRNNLPLDQAVVEFGKKVQVREAMDYLKS
jgi:hypothetical protein